MEKNLKKLKAKIEFDFEIEDDRWNKILTDDFTAKISQMLNLAMEKSVLQKHANSFFFTIFCINDQAIQHINLQERQIDRATNVLSFPALDPEILTHEISADCVDVGEIFVAYESISDESQEQNKEFESHLLHLILHGFLHLIGYDHIQDEEAELMESLEQEILKSFSIDPWI